jgi:murein DD-endopeptidase MepM/ murein hydrolase activator NlpD
LQDIPFEALSGMITNPFNPPKPGYDDPHAGIDIAVQIPGSQVAVAGQPVQAVMAGSVAMVAVDRFPFGNALIIETPLERLPATWQIVAGLPTPSPTLPPLSALTCPPYPLLAEVDENRRSIYTLYGHLAEAPSLAQGDEVTCGQVVGSVGGSGNALNPHLHYETRIGPSGILLAPIAHYDASATAEEMSAYCLWSVSGVFQIVDPHNALGILPPGD